jgi:hypothetical protein
MDKEKTMVEPRFFFAVFLTVLSTLTSCGAAQAREDLFYVDLQKFSLYIKADFNPSDAVSPDLQDGSWQIKEQWSSAVIRKLDLFGGGGVHFYRLGGSRYRNGLLYFPL